MALLVLSVAYFASVSFKRLKVWQKWKDKIRILSILNKNEINSVDLTFPCSLNFLNDIVDLKSEFWLEVNENYQEIEWFLPIGEYFHTLGIVVKWKKQNRKWKVEKRWEDGANDR